MITIDYSCHFLSLIYTKENSIVILVFLNSVNVVNEASKKVKLAIKNNVQYFLRIEAGRFHVICRFLQIGMLDETWIK